MSCLVFGAWHCSPLLSSKKFSLLDYSMDAPTTCYAIRAPDDDQILYERWVFRAAAYPCEDCHAWATTITPDMFLLANLHCLLCSPCDDFAGAQTSTWSSIFKRGDSLHYVYSHGIRPFMSSIPRLHVIYITNPHRLIRPGWFTDTVGNCCRSAGYKSAQACILRQRILRPLLDEKFPFARVTTTDRYEQEVITYHLIAEVMVDFLLGPGPCLRPLPAITALRRKGYIPQTFKLRCARLAIGDTDSGTHN